MASDRPETESQCAKNRAARDRQQHHQVQDRTLYYFRDGQVARSFPVGLGMLTALAETNWKTPLGRSGIIATAKDPIWYVPPPIQ